MNSSRSNSLTRPAAGAAARFLGQLQERALERARTQSPPRPTGADLIALLDATGSMQVQWLRTRDVIGEAVRRAATLAPVSMEWVAYRDYDSGPVPLECSGPTRDASMLEAFVRGIVCSGGNDTSGDGRAEAVEAALKYAADTGARRAILIGDAPPHLERDWRAQAMRLAAMQCPVHAFLVETYRDQDLELAQTIFKAIASLTGGTFHVLEDDPEYLAHVIAMTAIAERAPERIADYERRFLPSGASRKYLNELKQLPPPRER